MPGDSLRCYCGNELVVAVISNLYICETEFCILTSPAIWWRSVKLIRGSVTFGFHALTPIKYSKRCVCGGMLSSTSGFTRVIAKAKRIIVPITISRCPHSILVGLLAFPRKFRSFILSLQANSGLVIVNSAVLIFSSVSFIIVLTIHVSTVPAYFWVIFDI